MKKFRLRFFWLTGRFWILPTIHLERFDLPPVSWTIDLCWLKGMLSLEILHSEKESKDKDR